MMLLYWVGSFNLRQKGGAGGCYERGGSWESEEGFGGEAEEVTIKESRDKGNEEEKDGKWD